jgi:hypothetical protein
MFEAKGDRSSCLFGQEPKRYLDDRSTNVYIDERNYSTVLRYRGRKVPSLQYYRDVWEMAGSTRSYNQGRLYVGR